MRHKPARLNFMESLEVRKLLSAEIPNIMPMGDSITEGEAGHSSYRYWLWNQLADAGYTVNFAGMGADVGGGSPQYPGFDTDHEGHGGWRADDLRDWLKDPQFTDFAAQPQNHPDIVLLHIGSNDVEQGQSDISTRDEIASVIDNLRAINPNVTILLAQVTPETDHSMSGLNALIPGLVSAKNTSESRVILVDQASGFDAATDTYDGVHADEAGEKKMAAKWFAALAPLLPTPIPPPAGTYLDTPAVPLTNATNPVGPIEYEGSVGSDSAHDGQMLSLRGQKFMRGFGVHADSEMDFDLSGGSYTRFRATVGVDDEVDGIGSVVFQVYVNDESKPRFSSAALNGEDAAVSVDVDITGAKSLRLVVTDAGDGNDFDHADWAMARLVGGGGQNNPPPLPPPPTSGVPSRPKKLHTKVRGRGVNISWKDTSKNESGFKVQRKTQSGGRWQLLAYVGRNKHSYRDSHVASGARYFYRVIAFNDKGSSKPSNVEARTIPPLPRKVNNVFNTRADTGRIIGSANDNSGTLWSQVEDALNRR
jgi:lysophospholipase L1-like esterase